MQRILVVEDDLDIQELLKNFLQEAGYEVILASDGGPFHIFLLTI